MNLLLSCVGRRTYLAEWFREHLGPGGRVVALEITQSTLPGFTPVFRFYFHHVVPRVGQMVGGDREAYTYLPQSVDRFVTPSELCRLMERVGLRGVSYRRLGFGTVTVHTEARRNTRVLRVENTGPPLPADLVPTLTEPFQRGTERARTDEWKRKAEALTSDVRDLKLRLDDARGRLEEAQRGATFAREHLMAMETKLDLIEAAIQVLDTRTREAAVTRV